MIDGPARALAIGAALLSFAALVLSVIALLSGCSDLGEQADQLTGSWVCGWEVYRRTEVPGEPDTCWALDEQPGVLATDGSVTDPCDVERNARVAFRGGESITVWQSTYSDAVALEPDVHVREVACD